MSIKKRRIIGVILFVIAVTLSITGAYCSEEWEITCGQYRAIERYSKSEYNVKSFIVDAMEDGKITLGEFRSIQNKHTALKDDEPKKKVIKFVKNR
jgi:hypothetical protein